MVNESGCTSFRFCWKVYSAKGVCLWALHKPHPFLLPLDLVIVKSWKTWHHCGFGKSWLCTNISVKAAPVCKVIWLFENLFVSDSWIIASCFVSFSWSSVYVLEIIIWLYVFIFNVCLHSSGSYHNDREIVLIPWNKVVLLWKDSKITYFFSATWWSTMHVVQMKMCSPQLSVQYAEKWAYEGNLSVEPSLIQHIIQFQNS